MFIYDTERKITELGLNSCSTTVIPKGSIIISTRAPIGHIAILGDDMCFNQGCKGLIIKDNDIASEFVYYVLLTKIDLMKTLGSGPTFEELSKDKLASIEIPLPFRNGKPDLETQKKIVEYIEANFSRIDRILEKKKKELEQLDELWESVLEQAFKPKGREEWREVRLRRIVSLLRNGLTYKQFYRFPKENTVPVARIETIANEYIDKNSLGFLDTKSLSEEIINNWRLVEGDILFSHINSLPHLGKTAIYRGDPPYLLHGMNLIIIRLIKQIAFPEYINYFLRLLRSKGIFAFLAKKAINQASINQRTLKNLKIPLPFHNNQPDLEKQKEIASYLDRVYEKIKVLKERIQNQINQLEEMKESILDEVFNREDLYGRA